MFEGMVDLMRVAQCLVGLSYLHVIAFVIVIFYDNMFSVHVSVI